MGINLPLGFYRLSWGLWLAWFVAFEAAGINTPTNVWLWLAAFGLLEVIALLDRKEGDTLSENAVVIIHSFPLVWCISASAMVWFISHALNPSIEPLFGRGDTLMGTLRPIMHAHPALWFAFLGFFGWLWLHWFMPPIERWIDNIKN